MSPSPAQVEKAIANIQIKIDAKADECAALEWFVTLIPDCPLMPPPIPAGWWHALGAALTKYLNAKKRSAEVDREELRLVQIGYKQALDQMSSRIMKPGGILAQN